MNDDFRPDPDSLLKAIQRAEDQGRGGKLRVFFGMAAGVGKTYAMLKAAHQRLIDGTDIVIGTIDTHSRKDTAALVDGLPIIPRKQIQYKGTTIDEMDLDAILKRRPKIVLVDELAHSNAPGSRHHKRYQDVFELLDNGIDVYTTVNVQHIESRKEAVEKISGITIRESVPDSVFERASQIDLIDLAPSELLKRLKEGKVYLGERAETAQQNFFKEGPLTALREIALRMTAEKVDQDLQSLMESKQIQGPWKATERLMVAVSHSPYSERLIRATRALAYNLEAPWIAVNINRGQQLQEEDQNQLVKNLSLVRELGGELMTTAETDVPAALRRIAMQKNVTQIIVGRPTRRWFKDIIEGGSLLDQLVQVSGDFDVHVIRQDSIRPATQASWRRAVNLNSHFGDYWNVVWSLVVASIISAIASPLIGYKAVGFIFLLAVLGVSLFFSMGPILLAASASALIWDYFFIPPQLTFLITDKEDIIMCAMYFIAAFTTGMLTNKIRFHERLLKEREERTTLLYEIVSDIVSSSNRGEFIESICARVGKLLDGECGVYLKNPQGFLEIASPRSEPFALSEKALAVATWAFQANKRAGWSTDTLSEALALYTPLTGRGTPVGVLAFKPVSRRKLRIEHEILLTTVAKQLAISIERESFEAAARESESLKQSETLHQTLLNSVSHELRTPLTSIIGSATAMAELSKDGNAEFGHLAKEVVEGSERLNRVVENLLDMTRLNSGVLTLNKEWHDVPDLIGVTLQKLGRYKNHHVIRASLNENLSLIEIDFRLFEHVLSNLILNSVLYTPPKSIIDVKAWSDDKSFFLSVSDQGPGLSDELLERVFEKFYRVPGTPAGGTGLGLAISKSIIELHGGAIWAENIAPHGLKITIRLPLGTPPSVRV